MRRLQVRRHAGRVVPAALAMMVSAAAWAVPASAAGAELTPRSSWAPWKACAGKPKTNCAQVRAITRTPGGVVVIGGSFSHLRSPDGRQSVARSNIAALGANGAPVAAFAGRRISGTVLALATDGTSVWAGGTFSKVDGRAAPHLARFDAATGALRSTIAVNGTVYAAALSGGKLYVGGRFTSVQSQPRANLAAVNTTTNTLDPTWTPSAQLNVGDSYPNDAQHNTVPIRSLAAAGDRIYVSGDLDTMNRTPRPTIAAVTATTGATVKEFDARGAVKKYFQGFQVAVADGTGGRTPGVILAGGGLTNRAWRLSTTGQAVWRANVDGDAQAAAVLGNTVYIGGHFTCVSANTCFDKNTTDDIPRVHLAAYSYDGSGSRTPDAWAPQLGPSYSPYYFGVWTLEAFGNDLYVGGVFNSVVLGGATYRQPKFVRFAGS